VNDDYDDDDKCASDDDANMNEVLDHRRVAVVPSLTWNLDLDMALEVEKQAAEPFVVETLEEVTYQPHHQNSLLAVLEYLQEEDKNLE
jgi:homoaconitase/3-isopropylmalate dehydratase large subunit